MAKTYSKTFLHQVIFQINFSIPAIKYHLDSSIVDVCEESSNSKIKTSKNNNLSISVGQNQQVVTENNSRFFFDGSEIKIIIQHDLLQIIHHKYSDYESFHKIIERLFLKFKEVYKDFTSTRLALRYINNINFSDGNTFDFKGLIIDELLNPTITFKDQGLKRSVGQIQITDTNKNLSVNFTYGFNNSNYPNAIIKREFLLDFDCFVLFVGNEKIDSLTEVLYSIREKVNFLFEKCILDDLRIIMNQP